MARDSSKTGDMLRGYVRLVVFAFGLLVGVQVPGFVDQYAKRVSAHYIEATRNFSDFQRTADQYFGGSVAALIAHHSAAADPVFRDEARNIAAIYARVSMLKAELDALSGPLPARLVHLIFRPNREILNETIAAYSYTVPLNQDAILCGLTVGLLLAIIVESLLFGGMHTLRRRRHRVASVAVR
jgi:hypothetical protein